MNEYTDPESRAKIAALSHEVYRLSQKLEEQKQRHINEAMPDKYDPFDNPTEYKGFSSDYSKIQPGISEPGFSIPLAPDYTERKALKRFYGIGGWCMIFQFIASNGLGWLLVQLVVSLMILFNPDSERSAISEYIRGSSMLVSINMIVYIICNVLVAFIGMKWAKIRFTSLVRTTDFGFSRAFQYCTIGLLIGTIDLYLVAGASSIFLKYGIELIIDTSEIGTTFLGRTVDFLYSFAIAPITEEILFRGMMLRVFSKANQRFAVFATAIFFGLVHGNLQQFILATLLGIFLAHITLKHGSIIPAVIVHMFVNLSSIIIGYFANLSTFSSIVTYLVLLSAALLGVIMLLVFLGKDRLPSTTPAQVRRGLAVAMASFPFSGAIIIYVMDCIYTLLSNQ